MAKYYCVKCERFHHRGKIYEKHLKYKKSDNKKPINEDLNNSISVNEILNYDISEFRNIAKRQYKNLIEKMYMSKNYDMYAQEIRKLILYEEKSKT